MGATEKSLTADTDEGTVVVTKEFVSTPGLDKVMAIVTEKSPTADPGKGMAGITDESFSTQGSHESFAIVRD